MKVLIVDGNDVAADLLAELLDMHDHVARTTYSASQALRVVGEEAFDAALVDLHLPDMPGAALAVRLRSACPALTAIAITANSPAVVHGSKEAAIFAHVLQKPLDFDALLTKLVQHTGS